MYMQEGNTQRTVPRVHVKEWQWWKPQVELMPYKCDPVIQVTESAAHYLSNTGVQGILIVYIDCYLFKNCTD